MSDLTLFMRLRSDVSDFINGMRRSRNEIEGVRPASARLGQSFDGLKGKVIGLLAAWAGLEALKSFVSAVLQTSASFESLNTRLETLTGSSVLAERSFDWIKTFTANTPYDLNQVSEAYARLISVGLDAETMLKPVGDAVAAIGGGGEEIDRVVLALSQMQSKGKASAEELMQIAETGIPAFQILKEKLQLTSDQMNDIGNAGYEVNQVIEALMEGMSERFDGAMKKQSQTFNGLMGLITDQWVQFKAEVGDAGVFNFAKEILQDVLDKIKELRESGQLAEYARQISDALVFAGNGIKLLIDGFTMLADAVAAPFDMIYKLGMLIGSGFDASVYQLGIEQMESAGKKGLSKVDKANADHMLKVKDVETQITRVTQDLAEKRTRFKVQQWEEEKRVQEKRLSEAEKAEQDYTDKIKNLRQELADYSLSMEDRLRELRRENMSESRQQADIEAQVNEKLLASKQALANGDNDAAKARAEEAAALAEQLDNNSKAIALFGEAAEAAKSARQAEIDSAEAAREANKSHMEELQSNLDFVAKQLEDLGVPRETVIKADITQAETELQKLQQQLEKLQSATTVSPSLKGGENNSAQGFNKGGQLPGYSPTTDTIPARTLGGHNLMLAGGEYIVNAMRTRMMSPLLNFLNFAPLGNVQRMISGLQQQPVLKYASGGPLPSAPAASPNNGPPNMTQLNWSVGRQRGTLLAEENSLRPFLQAVERELQGT